MPSYVQSWGDVLVMSFQQMWYNVAAFVPRLVFAVVIFVIGWVVAVSIGKVISQML